MGLKHDLIKLQELGILNAETASKIEDYYTSQRKPAGPRLLLAFGILGALLIGSGILLIIAHNWDNLSRPFKTLLAFIPLLVGQGLVAFSLFSQRLSSLPWKEGSAIILILGLGGCLALISQIYQIPGELGSFLLIWVALSLPVTVLVRSSMASLLCLVGATWYACAYGYWGQPQQLPYWFPLLIAPTIWHYIWLINKEPLSNFTLYHHVLIPISFFITLGTVADQHTPLLFLAYMLLAGVIYLSGQRIKALSGNQNYTDPYQLFGSFAMIIILLMLSFSFFWEEYARHPLLHMWSSAEAIACLILFIIYLWLLWRNWVLRTWRVWPQWELTALVFTPVFLISLGHQLGPRILMNLLVLTSGIITIVEGARQDRLRELNYGLLIITALLVSRFFDLNISFVARGLIFVAIGIGFFLINYRMLKGKKL